jgi:hypothetical protein
MFSSERSCIMKEFLVVFYNRFACQTQTYKVIANDEKEAERLFYLKYPKESYHDCIENIAEL